MICELCGARASETHHIFNGALRKKSEEYGATIRLCRECHDAIHKNDAFRENLKAQYQQKIMDEQGWSIEDFRKVFYKSYL